MVLHTNFDCDICDYACNFRRTLRSHNTRKHIKELLIKRKLIKNQWKCQQSILTEFFLGVNIGSVFFSVILKLNLFNIEKSHIQPAEIFIYHNSTDEAECKECNKTFNINHKLAMHLYTEQQYSFDCEHCH